ncbi:hypothetical protein BV25DRAFT_1919912 [Artomyces pyxidatus]|uniref:Uncharacterized protein n=1 Tax=Artomyces pyxidatus TaxID=48021 RepID=A0ACB8SPJ7_9AGAM|nr:hypothetical protein BV25DRAFT_1919912 [Artomyces pyxidatus]
MAITLYLSGYLLSISQINDWANHHNVKHSVDDTFTVTAVRSYGRSLGFPSTFEFVDDGDDELHALLLTGFYETRRPLDPAAVPSLIPEDTPFARSVRKAAMLVLSLIVCALPSSTGGSPMINPAISMSSRDSVGLASANASTKCTDIENCRTRYNIIWSSLVTILACVWTAVHRNIPGPAKPNDSRLWRIILRILEVVKIVGVTLLAPEWVLAWAVRQFMNARDLVIELEDARSEAKNAWEAKGWVIDGMSRKSADEEDARGEAGDALLRSRTRHGGSEEDEHSMCRACKAQVCDTGRLGCKWTTRHGFFILMGGFHYYMNGEPIHPLSRWDVVELVKTGDLVPPTEDEIRVFGQGDVLSKGLAVVQTLWFVVQCISRRVEGLPITQLEVMTLAYTTITVAMYAAWWNKPQNVGGPVRIAGIKLPPPTSVRKETRFWRIFFVLAGAQDELVDLRKLTSDIPTFYGGGISYNNNDFVADVFALIAAMVFGAVHCAAWDYTFPSALERLLWRISSIAIVALPGGMLLGLLLVALWGSITESGELLFNMVMLTCILSGPMYVVARVLLLVLSFTTLQSIPPEAYQAVQWTLLIPHFT